jgi:hypothetical protein
MQRTGIAHVKINRSQYDRKNTGSKKRKIDNGRQTGIGSNIRSVGNDTVHNSVSQSDVIRMVGEIQPNIKSKYLYYNPENEIVVAQKLLEFNSVLKNLPGYYDRFWIGDESLPQLFSHVRSNVNDLLNKELVLYENEDNANEIKLVCRSSPYWSSQGYHPELMRISMMETQAPELYSLILNSIRYIKNRFGILTCTESYGWKYIEYEEAEGGEAFEFFKLLEYQIDKNELLEQLNAFETSDNELRSFILHTKKLINNTSELNLSDFLDAYANSDNGEIYFIEGFAFIWNDDFLTNDMMNMINDTINNCGVIEPAIFQELPEPTKQVTEDDMQLITQIQDWMEKLIHISYERNSYK